MVIYLVWYAPCYSDDPWEIMDAFTTFAAAEAYVEKYKYRMPLKIEQITVKSEFKA